MQTCSKQASTSEVARCIFVGRGKSFQNSAQPTIAKRMMRTTSKLVLFLPIAALFITSGQGTHTSQSCSNTNPGMAEGTTKHWNILMLSQNWPPAACVRFEEQSVKCNITGLKSWTIHGLWPTKAGTDEPTYCDNSSAFDPGKVQVLQPRLQQDWPEMQEIKDATYLWTREWCKHGTCGTDLNDLRDELHYFNKTLDLYDRLNLALFLSSEGITPSEKKNYSYHHVVERLSKRAGGKPLLTCVRSSANGKCYLEQVDLCMTKGFQPVDCVENNGKQNLFQREVTIARQKKSSSCSCDEELYYMPFP